MGGWRLETRDNGFLLIPFFFLNSWVSKLPPSPICHNNHFLPYSNLPFVMQTHFFLTPSLIFWSKCQNISWFKKTLYHTQPFQRQCELWGSFIGKLFSNCQIFIWSPKGFKSFLPGPKRPRGHWVCLYWPQRELYVVLKEWKGLFRDILGLK